MKQIQFNHIKYTKYYFYYYCIDIIYSFNDLTKKHIILLLFIK